MTFCAHAAAVLALAPVFLLAPAAAAQTPTVTPVAVTVRDSSGAGIAGAEVVIEGTNARGYTDDEGHLRLTALHTGLARVAVRRLGFRPGTVAVAIDTAGVAVANVTLVRTAQLLSPILVRARDYTGYMGDFYRRRDLGIGRFITRADLERQQPFRLTDVFRRIPGVRIVSTRLIENAIRFRGEHCAPLVWLDGTPAAAAEFDLDALPPESIEGIEVYSGVSEVPPQFMASGGLGSCGVVVVWSRHGEPREKKSKTHVTPAQLAELVAALKVYTAEEVDVPARPDTANPAQPRYPESLFLAGVTGRVEAEFVVDTAGQVDMTTFGVLSSTDPEFTASVRRALADAAYIPAQLRGHPVRQVVYQPFTFVIDSTMQRRLKTH
ncbi:MAG: TonB family protein [Gemmatimonadaceae bacterium]|nr:TonB family protein [Gemmatimonadaceae bacterium]